MIANSFTTTIQRRPHSRNSKNTNFVPQVQSLAPALSPSSLVSTYHQTNTCTTARLPHLGFQEKETISILSPNLILHHLDFH
ncbi:hypothetical protein LZ554_003148 [Drepanopeziza brunnea f. sp. 'monogermtubi']|nr:hypothetical protein LZ554_003148 [Drepanopeziza brunnea f. sp. 'monogermtubi']